MKIFDCQLYASSYNVVCGHYLYCLCACYIVLIFSAMGKHLMVHGDGVKDIAFEVEDCIGLYKVQYLISCSI